MNGLVQVPKLIKKMIESGIIETVKLVNDLYNDDLEIITINFETMKKISSKNLYYNIDLMIGREFMISRNLIPNLIKNINIVVSSNHNNSTVSGLTILDNLSRVDDGKHALKQNNCVIEISRQRCSDGFKNILKNYKFG